MFKSLFKRFLSETDGNFATIFAVCFVPIMLCAGAVVDYSNAVNLRAKAAQAADAAILAAVATVTEEGLLNGTDTEIAQRQAQIQTRMNDVFASFFEANRNYDSTFDLQDYNVTFDPITKEATVTVNNKFKPYIMDAFVSGEFDVAIKSSVIAAAPPPVPMSMFLVLDRSGSMGGSKIVDLKAAVNNMADMFKTSDPNKEYVRLGTIAYNHNTFLPQPLDWGTDHIRPYVNAMFAGGGTNSTGAMQVANGALQNPVEKLVHNNKTGLDPKKFLVFMTDGNNNQSSSDTNTKAVCDNAKTNNIEVFSIAFKAPNRGRQLLQYCASSADHYFDAQNSQQLNDAFQKIGRSAIESISLSG